MGEENLSPEKEWVVKVHESLFHISPTDMDDVYGTRIDELILLQAISDYPEILKHKSLRQLMDMFIPE